MPGSHVIVKTNGETEIPDRTYEEAARLAAYYSTGKEAPKVEIDYTSVCPCGNRFSLRIYAHIKIMQIIVSILSMNDNLHLL